jgi:ATP-dependent DNA helicase PIF1
MVLRASRWSQVKFLVIDEISMLDSQLFDKLNSIAKKVRGSKRPFGGIQLVLCGDFYQLPPVQLGKYGCKFAFESDTWQECKIRTVQLRKVHRQEGDFQFINLLREIRVGKCSPLTQELLAACHSSKKNAFPKDGIVPTRLYCVNKDVDEVFIHM